MSDLLNRMNNAVTRANMAATTAFDVLSGGEDAIVQVQGEQIPTLAARVKEYVTAILAGTSLDGEDGTGIEELYVDVAGHLQARLTGQATVTDLGLVRPEDGTGIDTVTLDPISGELSIKLTTGDTINLGRVTGEDAADITNAYIENANLKVELSDGTIFDAGDISQFGGISVNFVDLSESGDLLVIFSDGTITNLGKVVGERGEVGRSIISGYIDAAGNLVFLKNDSSQVNVGQVSLKIPDDNSVVITGAALGGVTGKELILTLSDASTVNVGRVVGDEGTAGVDGNGVASVSLDVNGLLQFTMDDESTSSVGPILNIDATQGSVFLTSATVNPSNELVLTVSANGEISEINVGNVKGKDGVDGMVVDNAQIDPVTNELTFRDAEGVQLFSAGAVDQNSIKAARIDVNGHLILTLTDDTEIDGGADIRGTDGVDGVGVTGAYIDDEGHLWFTFDTAPDADAGKVTAPVETDVTFIDDQLTITLSDGQQFGPFTIGGSDGDYMMSADIVNGELIIQMAKQGALNLGSIEKNPIEVKVNETGNLVIAFSDLTEITTLNRIQGVDGNTVDSVVLDEVTRDLVITTTVDDGTTTSELRIPETIGKSITGMEVVGEELLITVDNAAEPLRLTIPKGTDGNTITDISFTGNDLTITTSDDPTPVTIPSVQGDSIESVTVQGEDLVFNVSPSAEEIRFPTIKGIDAVESINDVYFDNEAGSLVIDMVTGPNIVIENARGIDGITIDRIYIGIDSELIIETSDGGLYQFPYLEGRDGDTIVSVELTPERDLVITYDIEGVVNTVTIPETKGRDGIDAATVAAASVNLEGQLVIDKSDETQLLVDGVGASVADVSVNQVSGQLEILMTDGNTFTSTESIRGRDGNGTGVSNVQYQTGDLIVTLEDVAGAQSTVNAGTVDVVNITNAETIEGDLVFTFSDGRPPVNVGRIMGKDGRHVTGAAIREVDKHLVLTMNDGSEIDAGNSRGQDGRSVTGVSILATNEFVVEYDDETVEVVGNIGGNDDLALWERSNVYRKDRVVIHKGSLYLSLDDRNGDEPPSAKWREIAFGDYLVSVRKPVCISPIDGESGLSKRPQLVMSKYAPLVSSDALGYREIEIKQGAYTYTAQHNKAGSQNVHEVEEDLAIEKTFTWKFRDVTENGVMSEWSDEQTFTVPDNAIATPTLKINDNENASAAFAAPQFETGVFDDSTGQVHTSTDWKIENEAGEVVWQSLADTTNLLSVIVPFGELEPSTIYKATAKHNGNTKSSGWSDVLTITTEGNFDYIETPVVVYDGDPESIASFPKFDVSSFRKSERFLPISANVSVSRVDVEWEVYNADTGEIHETLVLSNNETSMSVTEQFMNSVNYRTRVRYTTDRFGASEWSPYMLGKSEVTIDTPVVSTTGDELAFLFGDTFDATAFTAVNETHVSTDWEVRLVDTDEIVRSPYEDTENLLSYTPNIFSAGYNFKVRCKFNGENISTPWSEYLTVFITNTDKPIIGGDESLGFIGEVPASELFTGDELADLIGLTKGTSQYSDEPWLGFVIDRNIIYVAKKPYRNTVSWNDINAAGAVYDKPSSKTVTKGGDTFRVTLMRGANDDPTGSSGPHDQSEWDRLMHKVHVDDPAGTPWAEYTNADIVVGAGNGRFTWCQESTGSGRVVRGSSSLVDFNSYSASDAHTRRGWRPTLRLI